MISFHPPVFAKNVAAHLAMSLLAGVILMGSRHAQAAAGNPDLAIPVTADRSCEFGDIVFQNEVLGDSPGRLSWVGWTNLILGQAATHCSNGSKLSITRSTANVRAHDVFQVAALLCQRPDIKETEVVGKQFPWKDTLNFACTITKLDDIRARLARGEQAFNWKTDRVDPRPTDDEERRRRAFEAQGGAQASGGTPASSVKPPVDPKDCSVAANLNTNYCKSLFLPGIR